MVSTAAMIVGLSAFVSAAFAAAYGVAWLLRLRGKPLRWPGLMLSGAVGVLVFLLLLPYLQ
jgi:hypothetical protein